MVKQIFAVKSAVNNSFRFVDKLRGKCDCANVNIFSFHAVFEGISFVVGEPHTKRQ